MTFNPIVLRLKKTEKIEKTKSNPLGFFLFTSWFFLIPAFAFADVVDVLTNFLGYLTGGFGKAIATLAIVGLGFGCFMFGKVPKSVLISVVIGIGIIFGAAALLNMLSG